MPEGSITEAEFAQGTKEGRWRKPVEKLRALDKTDPKYKNSKQGLPAITISAELRTRDKSTPLKGKLKKHSGYICLDIDAQDNPKLDVRKLMDKDCLMQFVSCSGKGIKIIYKCKVAKDAAEHRRIFDACVERLEKMGVQIKVDPMVKSITSLQFVTFDPKLYHNPKTKLVIQPLPPIKRKTTKPSEDQQKELEKLNEYIEAIPKGKDITKKYDDWFAIAAGLSYSLGEAGREPFHKLSKNYAGYSELECDEFYDALLV